MIRSLKQLKNFDYIVYLSLLFVSTALSNYFHPNNYMLIDVFPHPGFILTILFSSYLGFRFSIIANIIFLIYFFSFLHLSLDYEEVESIIELRFVIIPLTTIITSLILGEICDSLRTKLNERADDLERKKKLVENLEYSVLIKDKEIDELKLRLVNKLDTITRLNENIISLWEPDQNKLIENFLNLIEKEVDISKSAFFRRGDSDQLVMEFTRGWSDEYGNKVNPVNLEDELARAALTEGRTVNLSDTLDSSISNDPQVKSALLAAPVYVDNEIFGIITAYEIPFLKFTPENMTIFDILAKWLGKSLEMALELSQLRSKSFLDPIYNIYKEDYFHERLEEEFEQSSIYNIPLTFVKVEIIGFDSLNRAQKVTVKKLLSEVISANLKKMDFVSLGKNESELYVLSMDHEGDVQEHIQTVSHKMGEFGLFEDEDILNYKFEYTKRNSEMKTFKDMMESVKGADD
jgi:hypothetical protein